VGAGTAVLCAIPAAFDLRPVPGVRVDPAALKAKILGSTGVGYQGTVSSTGRLALPALPQFGDLTSLFSADTDMRVWYAGRAAWRVAVVDAQGERDTYQTPDGVYVWDFERNLVTRIAGTVTVRLPWASDLVPADLARRVLGSAAPADRLSALPARRVAGVAAAGLRLVPADPDTTIGRVDVWADPDSGLPLAVEVASRTSASPLLTTRVLDLHRQAPDPAVLVPPRPGTAGFTTTSEPDLAAALNDRSFRLLPPTLAGRARTTTPGGVAGIGGYGTGLGMVVVVPLPGRFEDRFIDAAEQAGGVPLVYQDGALVERAGGLDGYALGNSAVNTMVLRAGYLLAGFVTQDLLRRVGGELFGRGVVFGR
jgi:hypothetical protein